VGGSFLLERPGRLPRNSAFSFRATA
jgi:hypothetical protein